MIQPGSSRRLQDYTHQIWDISNQIQARPCICLANVIYLPCLFDLYFKELQIPLEPAFMAKKTCEPLPQPHLRIIAKDKVALLYPVPKLEGSIIS